MERIVVATVGARSVDVWTDGPEDGPAVVMHHGTPESGLPYPPFVRDVTARGLRWVSYSRPGYGGSSRHPGRSVADCAEDVVAILDHLGSSRCYVVGTSGGGPHALACASLMPERVVAAATVASVAPYGAAGLDFLADMGPENIEEFGAALEGEARLRPMLGRAAAELTGISADQLVDSLGGLLSDVDAAALTGDFGRALLGSMREALRPGVDGWLDDDLAFTADWGLDLGSIRVPVTVWQGFQDRMVPPAHGRWLAERVHGARSRFEPDLGHISLYVGAFGRVLDDLQSVAPA